VRGTLLIGGLACFGATACAAHSAARWPNQYTLTGPTPASRAAGPPLAATLRVEAVTSPAWLNSRDMYYRLLYDGPSHIAAYSQARWVAPPGALVGSVIRGALTEAGQWAAVIGPSDEGRADLTLLLHLSDFEQVFSSADRSTGRLALRATLVNDATHAVVAQKRFAFRVKAATPDAPGGARALNEASHELAGSVIEWLQAAGGALETRGPDARRLLPPPRIIASRFLCRK
jgi:cholesterol transport system auxiliary component